MACLDLIIGGQFINKIINLCSDIIIEIGQCTNVDFLLLRCVSLIACESLS